VTKRVYLHVRIVHNLLRDSRPLRSGAAAGGNHLCNHSRLEDVIMNVRNVLAAACVTACLALVVQADQGPGAQDAAGQGAAGQGGARQSGPTRGGRGPATDGRLIGGTHTPAKADERGWGWQVKASINPATPRPFYNKAKELLFQDKQITSYTISTYNPDLYCEVGKHFDYVWFEMQHSTMSYDEVRRMILTCPGVGAAPMLRMPDALESSIQRATDLGAIGIIVPTVDDALEARDAARFSRYPPFGRRSSGGGSFGQVWPGVNYRATVNDNMLVTVMIETLEGVANAEEIAATHGVDVVLIGNNDLSSFSGWGQNDPRYQDALIKVHDAALKYGKYFGNAGAQYLNGYVLSADTRMVQNGPARDGWAPPRGGGAGRGAPPAGRGRGDNLPEPDAEPVIGLPGGLQPGSSSGRGGRGQ
jgi:2-keto-3-deoxy-L-rhamnonate aldolase RhmA